MRWWRRLTGINSLSVIFLFSGKRKNDIILSEMKHRIIPNKKGGSAYQVEKVTSKKYNFKEESQ